MNLPVETRTTSSGLSTTGGRRGFFGGGRGLTRAPKVQLSSYEVLIAVAPGWTSQDVNAIPECLRLSLPCTRGSPGRAGGVGLAVSMSRYLRKPADAHQAGALAITVDASRFSSAYDNSDGRGAIRRARMHATSVLVGPRITTSFLYEDRRSPRPGRYFFHALVGGQRSMWRGPARRSSSAAEGKWSFQVATRAGTCPVPRAP